MRFAFLNSASGFHLADAMLAVVPITLGVFVALNQRAVAYYASDGRSHFINFACSVMEL